MRQFQTAVLEFKKEYTERFTSAPFECAWASEAIFFIRVEAVSGRAPELRARVQLSVDGLHWIDEGTEFTPITKSGDYFARVRHFGGFLRLVSEISGEEARFKVTNNLVLKE